MKQGAPGMMGSLLPVVAIWGCAGDPPDADGSFVVTDSASVEVVRNHVPEDALPLRVLEGDSVLRLTSERPADPAFFGQINSIHFGPDGALWVADAMNAELRVFEVPSGEHRFTFGGRGEGPGEFRLPQPIGFGVEGEAWIWDQQLGRMTVIGPEGSLVEVAPVSREAGLVPRLIHRTQTGRFFVRLPQAVSAADADAMILQDTVRIWTMDDLDGEPELVAERQGVTWYYAGGVQAPIPFSEGSRFGILGDRLVLTDPAGGASLDEVVDGRLIRRIHVVRRPNPVTEERLEENLQGPTRAPEAAARIREALPRLPLPSSIPTWEWVRLSPSGHVFALRYGTLLAEEVWDVFAPDGRLLMALRLPEDHHLMDVSEEFVALLQMPEMQGPAVVVYPLEGL